MNSTTGSSRNSECDILSAVLVVARWWMILRLLHVLFSPRCSGPKKRTKEGTGRTRSASDAKPDASSGRLVSIVGLDTVKEDIRQYVDYVNHPEVYRGWGVTLPKGVLLSGPPGTGKTMLVRTMAGEMGIPVETACGSEFVEMYVGVGAARVRELFERAHEHGRCVVFIDEIDAIGKRRGRDHNSERDATLNQLLVEMDGFEPGSGIIVFAATNLPGGLDPALTRSGRFDRKVFFDPPNRDERKRMWTMFLEGVETPRECGPSALAEKSAGLTGADISNVCNLAKLMAIKRGASRMKLTCADLHEALDEVMVGREKKERTMSQSERERVAHHEAGHALLAHMLQGCEPPIKVSIVPRGEAALGFSQQNPEDARLYTREAILARVVVLLGGRAAEQFIYGDVSTGASDDIERATQLIRRFVGEWGMDLDTGPVNTDVIDSDTAERCRYLLETLAKRSLALVSSQSRAIKAFAAQLLRHGTLDRSQLAKLLPKRTLNKFRTGVDAGGS